MALAVVQSVIKAGNNVTSVTTAAIATTSGNLLVADIGYFGTYSTFTDSGSHTWSVSITDFACGGSGRMAQKYTENITGQASHTFTLTLTGNNYPTVAVKEISGAATSGSLDKTSTTLGGASTSHTSGATGTTTQADEICCGAGSTGTITTFASTAYTVDQNQATTSSFEGLLSTNLIVSTTGAQTFLFTSGTSSVAAGMVATFKQASTQSVVPVLMAQYRQRAQ